MLTSGIDIGAKTVKAVLMQDKKIIAKSITLATYETEKSAEECLNLALKNGNMKREQVEKITTTGAGRKKVSFANSELTEVGADAKGVFYFYPNVRTIIDVGAEEGRAIKVKDGKVVDFAVNEKCAAGAGTFIETMARALEVKMEEFGSLSLNSTKTIPMNAQCAVFAESEVVSLIHAKTPKEDIAKAVHDAMASRIVSMVRRIGIEKEIILIGGTAKNIGFVNSLKTELGEIIVPKDDCEFFGAIGSAIE